MAASKESGEKGPGRYIHNTDSGDFFQENYYEETEEIRYWDYHLQKRRLHTMNIAKTIYSCKHTEVDVVYTPDIVYAHRESGDLTMQIVSPIAPDLPRKEENLTFNKMMPAAEVFQCSVAGSLYTRFITVPEDFQNLAISFTP